MTFDTDYWADRIEGATDYDARQAVMKLRDKALHRALVDAFSAAGYMPSNFRKKQHKRVSSKGKRICGQMRKRQ